MERTYELLTLSARTPTSLERAARDLAAHRQAHPDQSLADLAYTLHVARPAYDRRLALVAAPGADPVAAEPGEPLKQPRIAFLFTGQGAQYAGMGGQLYASCPAYRRELDRCAKILAPYFPAGFQPHQLAEAQLQETEYAQPALFALEYALAQLWISWGVQPALVMGHSLGEFVAATVAGALPLEEALPLVVARGRLMQARCEVGTMLSLMASPAAAEPYLSDEVCLAAANAPQQVVLAGRPAALDALAERLDRDGVKYRKLNVTRAFHSPLAEPMLDVFEARAALVKPGPLQIPMVSNVTGQVLATPPDAAYWRRHVREPVRFADGVAAAAAATGINVFLEIGPHPVLRSLVDQSGLTGALSAASLRRGDDDWKSLLTGLGRLWAHGVAVDWAAFEGGQHRRRVHAPAYAFDRESHWLKVTPAVAVAAALAAAPAAATTPATPTTPATTEARLAGLWHNVLGRTPAAPADDFFTMGGDSLTLLQLHARIRQTFGAEPKLSDLFDATGFGDMLALVRRLTGEPAGEAALQPIPRDGNLPLSFAQQRLWFMDKLESGSAFYNLPMALRLRGELDRPALETALAEIFRRHEALRTVFAEQEGNPLQVILPPPDIALPPVPAATEAEAMQILEADAARPFDLSCDLMLRPLLVQLGPTDHILSLTQHHIASDGWSSGVLIGELTALYEAARRGAPSPLPPLPIQYADFAAWQRAWLQGPALERLHAYWKERLGGELPVLQLPTDRPRPAVQSYRGAILTDQVAPGLAAGLKRLAKQEGATLYMVLLAGYLTLLHRLTGQTDLIVGSPTAGRQRVETEGLIGFFVNTLVLRTDLSGNPSFRELLARVREAALGAFAHQELQFEQLVELLQPERNLSYAPIFQTLFSLQNSPMPDLKLGDLEIAPVSLDAGTARFDLTLAVQDVSGELAVLAEYNTDLFDAATVRSIVARWQLLLGAAVADPDLPVAGLPFLTGAERQQILVGFNDTARAYRQDVCLHELIAEQAERTPEAEAVVCEGRRLSYRELNRRANQLAHHLRKLGVGPDVMVGIAMERSLEMVVGLVGILKAGGAYVPLDPTYPPERLGFMLADAEVPVLLTQAHLAEKLPEQQARVLCLDLERGWTELAAESEANPLNRNEPANTAYVIFTSGSTGRPKGVMVPHQGIVNRLLWMQEEYQLTLADRVMQKTTFCFDVSVWEFFWPLITGATMVMAKPEGHKDSGYLVQLIRAEQVTTMHFVPSMLQVFVEEPELAQCQSLRQVMCSGEALPPDLVEGFYGRAPAHVQVHNLYGPTEASVDVTYWACPRDTRLESVPIGRPVANTQLYILDRMLQPVPIGVPGELHIGGVQLAKGYLKRPDLTAEKFINSPYGRIYKTGDLAKYRADGAIEYLGRIDHQVKIRGFRIELGEIEAAIGRHNGVHETVVLAREDQSGQKQLVAYVVPAAAATLTANELREWLKQDLPEYMVPAHFVFLEAMPLSANGKLDRKALPAPVVALAADRVPPRTPRELQLVPIWESVLRVSPIGVTDNFFELGGHSLMVVKLLNAVRDATGKQLPIASLFQGPTIARQAELLEQQQGDLPWTPVVALRSTGARPPFFCVHGGFGSIFVFADLARELGPDQPFYGLQPRGLYDDLPPNRTVPEMAACYLEAIREVQPHGPYYLGGYCLGGLVAQYMARLLEEAGEEVPVVCMLDTTLPIPGKTMETCDDDYSFLRSWAYDETWDSMTVEEQWAYAWHGCEDTGRMLPPGITDVDGFKRWIRVFRGNSQANGAYRLAFAPGPVVQFLALEQPGDPMLNWGPHLDRLEIVDVPGDHDSMLQHPQVPVLAERLREVLTRAAEVGNRPVRAPGGEEAEVSRLNSTAFDKEREISTCKADR